MRLAEILSQYAVARPLDFKWVHKLFYDNKALYEVVRPANHECLWNHTTLVDIRDFQDWYDDKMNGNPADCILSDFIEWYQESGIDDQVDIEATETDIVKQLIAAEEKK